MQNTFYFVELDIGNVIKIFNNYDPYAIVVSCELIHQTQCADTYLVKANNAEYILKVYPKEISHVDISIYSFLKDKVNVPQILYHDETGKIVPYHYTIREYIKGKTLDKYIKDNAEYPNWIIKEIAKEMALMHNNTFLKGGKLNRNLAIIQENQLIINKLYYLVKGEAGKQLDEKSRNHLQEILRNSYRLFEKIEQCQCLTHGNLNYKNIIVSEDNEVYFIDFENVRANSWFIDIGSFFRIQDNDIEKLINLTLIDNFFQVYNLYSIYQLPKNWKLLAHLTDLINILKVIDMKEVDQKKIDYVQQALLVVFKEYASYEKEV